MKWKKCYEKFQQNLWKISVKELFCNKGHLLAELSFPNVKKKLKKMVPLAWCLSHILLLMSN